MTKKVSLLAAGVLVALLQGAALTPAHAGGVPPAPCSPNCTDHPTIHPGGGPNVGPSTGGSTGTSGGTTTHQSPPPPAPVKKPDYCPNGDYSRSRYDGVCGMSPAQVAAANKAEQEQQAKVAAQAKKHAAELKAAKEKADKEEAARVAAAKAKEAAAKAASEKRAADAQAKVAREQADSDRTKAIGLTATVVGIPTLLGFLLWLYRRVGRKA